MCGVMCPPACHPRAVAGAAPAPCLPLAETLCSTTGGITRAYMQRSYVQRMQPAIDSVKRTMFICALICCLLAS